MNTRRRWVASIALFALALARGAFAEGEFGGDLSALARASGRPEECGGTARLTRWDRARTPGLGAYCDALTLGYAALSTSLDAAVQAAERADATLPGHAAPHVLAARAEVRRAQWQKAWDEFSRARAISEKSLEAPGALRDYAVAALHTAHAAEALAAYRTLVPRAELLGDAREESAVLVEAAALVTAQGKSALSEALGYLGEARRRTKEPGMRDVVLAELALTLSRADRKSEADGIASESSGPTWLEAERTRISQGKPSTVPLLPVGELDAMIAVLAERTDRDLAIERWQSYLASEAGKSSPFAAMARARKDAVSRREKR
jgi:hypothetical protein